MSDNKKDKTYYKELSEERKNLQDNCLLPKWFSTSGYQLFKEKYQWANNFKEQITAIADTLARHTDDYDKWNRKFFEAMWKGWLSPSTPILSNCGTSRGLIVSCSGQYVTDSIDGFYTARHESAVLTQEGFGTSAYLGDIRPRGSKISRGGSAEGIAPVLKGFIQMSRDVSQGGVRRGSFAGYIPIDHGDFWELVTYLENEPDDLNIGWNITDEFIEKLKSGDVDARARFSKVLKVKMVTGKGYFWFIDKANRALPERYKADGLKNHASNLCLTGDTEIEILFRGEVYDVRLDEFTENFAKHHYFDGVYVNSYDGNKVVWSKVLAAGKTGDVDELVEINGAGSSILCTKDHLIYTSNRGYVRAVELGLTDEILVNTGVGLNPTSVRSLVGNATVPVYDITVEETECFFANDILVHNCSEILLPANEELTYTCVLASLNLAEYDSWKDTDLVETATEFLDAVCSEFIHKAKGINGLQNALRFTERYRAIGIGVMGFHTLLQKRMIPFESLDAMYINAEVFDLIRSRAEKQSNGRNASLIAVAPTKSTALIQGGISEGINPDPAYAFTQATAGGEMERVNPVLIELMKTKGVYVKKNIREVIDAFGSVQGVDWLTDDEKKVFKTAFEIDQHVVVRLAAQRAKYIDQWQSVNLFFPAGVDPNLIAAVHQEAFLDERIRGLYYIYSKAGVSASKGDCEACAS